MGNRSYLLTEGDGRFEMQLEANGLLPLLWVATAAGAHVRAFASLPGAAMGLDGATPVVSVPLAEALDQLRRRRALIDRWLGSAGATVLDQFTQLLRASQAERIHLALDEWIALHDSADAALATLQKAVEALDSDPSKGTAKRRPPPVKWLMDSFELSGVEDTEPLFGLALAGARDDDSEAWHRDPPRKRRTPAEELFWTSGDRLVSQDGQVVMVRVRNRAGLETPLIWHRAAGSAALMAVPEAVEDVYPHLIAPDGSVIAGSCVVYPGKRQLPFRYRAGEFTLMEIGTERRFSATGISADGSVLVGYSAPKGDWRVEFATRRATRWSANEMQLIGPDGLVSHAQLVTPDGAIVALYSEQGPLESRQQRAFVWSASGGLEDVGAAYFALEWLAISADGQRGLLRSMSVRGGPWDYHYWQRGTALRLIPELHGVEAWRVSCAVDAILANPPQGGQPLVWTAAGGVRTLDTGKDADRVRLLYIADGADCVALSHAPADGADHEILVFDAAGQCATYPLGAQNVGGVGWWTQNRSPDLDGFVTVGVPRNIRYPVIWTRAGGLQRPPFELP